MAMTMLELRRHVLKDSICRAARDLRNQTRNLVHGEDGDTDAIEAWEELDRAITEFDDFAVAQAAPPTAPAAVPPIFVATQSCEACRGLGAVHVGGSVGERTCNRCAGRGFHPIDGAAPAAEPRAASPDSADKPAPRRGDKETP